MCRCRISSSTCRRRPTCSSAGCANARKRPTTTTPLPTEEYLAELNEAYNHFFFHYTATPLLVVETSQLDLSWGDEAVDDLLRQIRTMGAGRGTTCPEPGQSSEIAIEPRSIAVLRMAWFKKTRKPIAAPEQGQPGARGALGQVSVVQPGASTTRIWSTSSRSARSATTTSACRPPIG